MHMSRSNCGELGSPAIDPSAPTLRRSARLLSKQLRQQEPFKKEQDRSLLDYPSLIQQQVSIRSTRSRLQSTSSVASSSTSSITGGFSESAASQKYRSPTLPRSPVQSNKRCKRSSERLRRKNSASSGANDQSLEPLDVEICPDDTTLRRTPGQKARSDSNKNSGRTEEAERKVTGKRTRLSNSDSYSPSSKRKRASFQSESKVTASLGGSRKRPRRTIDTSQNTDSAASSGLELVKRSRVKSTPVVVTADKASETTVKVARRTTRSSTKDNRSEEQIPTLLDSDSSLALHTCFRRRTRSRVLSKPEQSDSESPQPPTKDRTKEGCVPTSNHFYSLPSLPEFVRLTMASEG